MKKLLFLITSILAIGAACVSAGCNAQSGPDATNQRSYNIEQQNGDTEIPAEDENDCEDGNCEDKINDSLPEFKFRPHRHFYGQGERNHERETVDGDDNGDDGENENPLPGHADPVHPHKAHPNKKHPSPKPMPLKPRK
ncbi:MAG: hypothetical protein K2H30_05940 [Clostridia bacterium]|nr:hypothetical protein [Clostridia bacterium]